MKSVDGHPERRRSHRLGLTLPVRFCSHSPTGASREGQGFTVDICSGGIRFETDAANPPQPQTEIALYVSVPRHDDDRSQSVFISARATVLRCEPLDPTTRHHTGARSALAVRFDANPDISLPIQEGFAFGGP